MNKNKNKNNKNGKRIDLVAIFEQQQPTIDHHHHNLNVRHTRSILFSIVGSLSEVHRCHARRCISSFDPTAIVPV